MHDRHISNLAHVRMSILRDEAARQLHATGSPIARIVVGVRRHNRTVRSALVRIAVRGQPGPSVGYPHDRHPEPPF